MLQGFRLSQTLIMTAHGVFQKFVDPSDHFLVCLLPVVVVIPRVWRKKKFHTLDNSLIFFVTPLPESRLSIELNNLLALAGDLSK